MDRNAQFHPSAVFSLKTRWLNQTQIRSEFSTLDKYLVLYLESNTKCSVMQPVALIQYWMRMSMIRKLLRLPSNVTYAA